LEDTSARHRFLCSPPPSFLRLLNEKKIPSEQQHNQKKSKWNVDRAKSKQWRPRYWSQSYQCMIKGYWNMCCSATDYNILFFFSFRESWSLPFNGFSDGPNT
jgi:hypothetical protein